MSIHLKSLCAIWVIFAYNFSFAEPIANNSFSVNTIVHDNEFDFHRDITIPLIEFQPLNVQDCTNNPNCMVTPGQPWGGVAAYQETDYSEVHAQAGRKGNEDVATAFNAKVGYDDNKMLGLMTFSTSHPGALNFWFGGRLYLDSFSQAVKGTVWLGQGHNSYGNNWWIANEYAQKINGQFVVTTEAGGLYCIIPSMNPTNYTHNVHVSEFDSNQGKCITGNEKPGD